MKHLLLLSFIALSVQLFAQQTWFVDASNTGTQDGTSWATALTDLQAALDTSDQGDSIFVAAGTYYPSYLYNSSLSDRNKTFKIWINRHVYGGFVGTETSLADRASDSTSLHWTNKSILSGDIGASGIFSDNVYHVVTPDGQSTLDGFTIRGGNANGTDSLLLAWGTITIHNNRGAGMYAHFTQANINNVVFTENVAARAGGGLYTHSDYGSYTNCIFYGNIVDWDIPQDGVSGGGAVHNESSHASFEHCRFELNKNLGGQGGGAVRSIEFSEVEFEHCRFVNNQSLGNGTDGGGAFYNASGSEVHLDSCLLTGNFTDNQGGASYSDNSIIIISNSQILSNIGEGGAGAMENDAGSDAVLTNVLFKDNSTNNDGGAIQNWKSSPVIDGCTFEGNNAGNDGGALFNYNECSPWVSNSIFKGNEAGQNGGAIYNRRDCHPVLTNLLIYGNSAQQFGGGAYTMMSNSSPCSPIGTNLTITENEAGVSGGGVYDDGAGDSKLRNSIIYNNDAPSDPEVYAPASLAATAIAHDIIGDEYLASGTSTPIIWSGQLFLNPGNHDYRLFSLSAATDVGDSNFFAPNANPNISSFNLDLDDADRIQGTNIDLGAYETCVDTTSIDVTIDVSPGDSVMDSTLVTFSSTVMNNSAPVMYQWYMNGSPILGATGNSYSAVSGVDFDSADVFNVQIVADEPCLYSDTAISNAIEMLIYTLPTDTSDTVPDDSTIGITSIQRAKIRAYPNPVFAGSIVVIEGIGLEDQTATLHDLLGREIASVRLENQQMTLPSNLKTGIYFVRLEPRFGSSISLKPLMIKSK